MLGLFQVFDSRQDGDFDGVMFFFWVVFFNIFFSCKVVKNVSFIETKTDKCPELFLEFQP